MAEELKHEQYAEDLALHALGALGAASAANLESHLESCSSCRSELACFRADAALLALSTTGAAPPLHSRERLLSAIAKEPAIQAVPVRRRWWSLAPVFASLALAIFAILLLRENMGLKRANDGLHQQIASIQPESEHARKVLALMTASDAAHLTLVSAKTHPEPQIKTIYQQRSGMVLLMASNMPPVPANKTYELWLLPMQGAPMPVTTFKPDAHGAAMMMPNDPMVPPGTEAKTFAVTMEDEGGASTPTMPILMTGAGE